MGSHLALEAISSGAGLAVSSGQRVGSCWCSILGSTSNLLVTAMHPDDGVQEDFFFTLCHFPRTNSLGFRRSSRGTGPLCGLGSKPGPGSSSWMAALVTADSAESLKWNMSVFTVQVATKGRIHKAEDHYPTHYVSCQKLFSYGQQSVAQHWCLCVEITVLCSLKC